MWNNGSRKIREQEKNHGLLTLWELLKQHAIADVEVGQSFAITEPFGDCGKTDMCENGSEMVQAKYKVTC